MEKVLLGVILVAVLIVVARTVRRVIASGADDSKPPSCAGCPFDSKCEMQDKPHVSSSGSEDSE